MAVSGTERAPRGLAPAKSALRSTGSAPLAANPSHLKVHNTVQACARPSLMSRCCAIRARHEKMAG
ncbi:hypothetical protein DGM98_16675 [Xanthomonas citri]|uniref:Uncharacterized protein n=1 Tax=Xanthomonas campestris pv. phaseoli TaxID=317013 RepID=A0A7Z7IZW3_XANCH|nr:hypothetical protein DGM98_16675 [Xanthomonas citri]SOO24696.1 hypothetical protein XFF6991_390144 [Xanthomonas phaseoli pv. phaseoli]